MNIEEIFTKLLEHMMKGVKFHEQATIYFNFLTLAGYTRCQEYHYYDEIINYRNLYNYYIDNYKKLLKITPQEYELINNNMYKYSRENIDANNKREIIRDIMRKWVAWETETKELLEEVDLSDMDGFQENVKNNILRIIGEEDSKCEQC